MEFLIVIVAIFFAGKILRAIFAGGKAVATGKSYKESYRGIDDFSARLQTSYTKTESGENFEVKKVQIKGLLPLDNPANLTAIVSLMDVTDEEDQHPVISYIDSLQEPSTTCFLQQQPMGDFEPGVGFTDWVQIGAIVPNFIQPPHSGSRTLEARMFLVNSNTIPDFIAGMAPGIRDADIIALEFFKFDYDFDEKGYLDSSKDQKKARAITVKIAMAVAMSDGSLDEAEGLAIKNWIKKSIASFSGERQKDLKDLYNKAMKDSYALAKKGNLSLGKLTKELNELDEVKIKYDAINLCFEVMAADGKAESSEMDMIKKISKSLDLDPDEVAKMRDKKMLSLGIVGQESASLEEMLGIEPSWDDNKVKLHLMNEFKKWNNRINSLPQGQDRDFAQRMLNNIAEARKKYG